MGRHFCASEKSLHSVAILLSRMRHTDKRTMYVVYDVLAERTNRLRGLSGDSKVSCVREEERGRTLVLG